MYVRVGVNNCLPRRRAEEVKEEQKHRVYMENRMNALLELKNDIEASQVIAII